LCTIYFSVATGISDKFEVDVKGGIRIEVVRVIWRRIFWTLTYVEDFDKIVVSICAKRKSRQLSEDKEFLNRNLFR
jgi:hypothetical protein